MKSSHLTNYLSYCIILLSMLASGGGLLIDGLYMDTDLIKLAWLGNDLVTFLVVIPFMMTSLWFSIRGSGRAKIIWMGLLAYTIYNYAFYLFGAAFNNLFLVYVSIFSLSLYALILEFIHFDFDSSAQYFNEKIPVRWISIFLLLVSIPLALVEISLIVTSIVKGTAPEIPSLIFALDLSIVIPNTALAAILLWKHRSWGYVLGGIMLVKSFTYGMVLTVSSTIIGLKGTWDPFLPFYSFVALGGLIFLYVLFRNYSPPQTYP